MNGVHVADGNGLSIRLGKETPEIHVDAVTAGADESNGNSLTGRDGSGITHRR
jgi:hypothetical protein